MDMDADTATQAAGTKRNLALTIGCRTRPNSPSVLDGKVVALVRGWAKGKEAETLAAAAAGAAISPPPRPEEG